MRAVKEIFKLSLEDIGLSENVIEHSISVRFFTYLSLITSILIISIAEWQLLGEKGLLFRNLRDTLLLSVGYVYSYLMRRKSLFLVKLVLAILMFLALINFFRELAFQALDPRIPLAHLLIELQVLHSFDLPRNKDLFYSLMGSLVLFLVALVLSPSGAPILLSFIWLIPFLIAISFMNFSRFLRERVERGVQVSWIGIIGLSLFIWFISLTAYVILPKPYTSKVIMFYMLPMDLYSYFKRYREANNQEANAQDTLRMGSIVKPRGLKENLDEVPLQYPYASPGEEVIFKFKGAYSSYQRLVTYDYYDGNKWFRLRKGIIPSTPSGYSFLVSYPHPKLVKADDKVSYQYFMVLSEAPGLVVAPTFIYQLLFPVENVYLDDNDNLLLPMALTKGITYTVLFLPSPEVDLKIPLNEYYSSLAPARAYIAPYLEVDSLTPGVLQASWEISEGATTLEELLSNLRSYLSNFKYDTSVSFNPSEDILTQFLKERRGYCIHFATATVIFLRLNGIPARFVSGYLVTKYDPLSGYQIVRRSDGHAWAEMLIPTDEGYIWYPLDMTPLAMPYMIGGAGTNEGLRELLQTAFKSLKGILALTLRVPVLGEISLGSLLNFLLLGFIISLIVYSLLKYVLLKIRVLILKRRLRSPDLITAYNSALEIAELGGFKRDRYLTLKEYVSTLESVSEIERGASRGLIDSDTLMESLTLLKEKLHMYYRLRFGRGERGG